LISTSRKQCPALACECFVHIIETIEDVNDDCDEEEEDEDEEEAEVELD
jgi:hypothetical protein